MILSIELDETPIEAAMRISGAKTLDDLVDWALRDYIEAHERIYGPIDNTV
jgi:Arc/MetJ family transcription regulator